MKIAKRLPRGGLLAFGMGARRWAAAGGEVIPWRTVEPTPRGLPFLRRLSKDPLVSSYSNVFIIGNGAIGGGEEPLKAWLSETRGEGAGTFFDAAPWSHALIRFSLELRMQRKRTANPANDGAAVLEELSRQRARLATLYVAAEASGSLKARDLPSEIKDVLYASDTLVICTNWDPVFWNDRHLKSIIQLHGSALRPPTMVVPGDVLLDYMGKGPNKQMHHLIADDIPDEDLLAMGLVHRDVTEALERCNSIYLWGSAINDYDTEILTILALSNHAKRGVNLTVVNPDGDAGVRAAGLLKLRQFVHIDPLSGHKKCKVVVGDQWNQKTQSWVSKSK